ncbi:MAG: phasin family protein [Planctomycetota bacterium]
MDPLKNFLLAGLGAFSYSQEKLKTMVKELIDKGEFTREQGQRILDEWLTRGQAEHDKMSGRVADELRKLLDKLSLVSRADYDALKKRVDDLEARFGAKG